MKEQCISDVLSMDSFSKHPVKLRTGREICPALSVSLLCFMFYSFDKVGETKREYSDVKAARDMVKRSKRARNGATVYSLCHH